jgi:hypothetical protein
MDQDTCRIIAQEKTRGSAIRSDDEGDARLRGRVIRVQCASRAGSGQEYIAVIQPSHIYRGEVKAPVEVAFGKSSPSGTFSLGDEVELILTRQRNSWVIGSPDHKKVIRAAASALPRCGGSEKKN